MGDSHEGRDEGLAGICPPPEDGVIVLAMSIGIFERELRFANPPQSTDSLWLRQGGLLSILQRGCQLGHHMLLLGEKRIPSEGDIPKRWQGAHFGVAGISQQRQIWIDSD